MRPRSAASGWGSRTGGSTTSGGRSSSPGARQEASASASGWTRATPPGEVRSRAPSTSSAVRTGPGGPVAAPVDVDEGGDGDVSPDAVPAPVSEVGAVPPAPGLTERGSTLPAGPQDASVRPGASTETRHRTSTEASPRGGRRGSGASVGPCSLPRGPPWSPPTPRARPATHLRPDTGGSEGRPPRRGRRRAAPDPGPRHPACGPPAPPLRPEVGASTSVPTSDGAPSSTGEGRSRPGDDRDGSSPLSTPRRSRPGRPPRSPCTWRACRCRSGAWSR